MKGMRHVRFTMETGEGGEGIVPLIFRNWDSYTPTGDFGIAHDLLEHGTKETGEIWQELRALGALLYVRGFDVFKNRYNSNEPKHYATLAGESFCYELQSIYQNADEFGASETLPRIAPRKFRGSLEGKFALLEHSMIMSANKLWQGEYGDQDEEGNELYDAPYKDDVALIVAHIREGYFQARKRYAGEYVAHVRDAIMNEVKRRWSWLAEYTETGEVFTLSYNLDGHCKITSQNYL